MASFFDRVSNKTKNVIDGTSYKSQVKQNEALLNRYYAEIGRLYFLERQDNPPANMVGLFNKASETQRNIEFYKKKVMDTKGIKLCPLCGEEIVSVSKFCPKCGQNIVEIVDAPESYTQAEEVESEQENN